MMKKILAVLGSLTLFSSSTATVVACVNNTNQQAEDTSQYDNSAEVQNISRNAVNRLKSLVLADQFGISDNVYWSKIVQFDPQDQFSQLFDLNSVNGAMKQGMDLTGRGGEDNILLKEGLEAIMGQLSNINIAGIDLNIPDIINGLLPGGNLEDQITAFDPVITELPAIIANQSIQQLINWVPTVIGLLSSAVTPLLGGVTDGQLRGAASVVSSILLSVIKEYGVKHILDLLIEETSIDKYKDLTFQNLSTRLWGSLLTTVGYAVNPEYVSNPETELNVDNAERLMKKFNTSVIEKKEIEEVEAGEVKEEFGVVKYAFQTIKLLELYFQFFGENFFTYVPDVNDWTRANGNSHLFSTSQTNTDYWKSLDVLKVESLTQVKPGINLPFLWKIFKTFLANEEHQSTGVMFQKFFNALLINYNQNGAFSIPILNTYLHFLLGSAGAAINLLSTYLEGLFTNKNISGLVLTIELALRLPGNTIPPDIRPILTELLSFLKSSPAGESFLNKPFDYLWSKDISLILPSVLSSIKNDLKMEVMSLSNFVYEWKIPTIFNLIGIDLSKYGSEYTDLSIAGFINKMDSFIKINDTTYADLNNQNLDLNLVKELIDILTVDSLIKLEPGEDLDSDPNFGDNSLTRQLISNIKNPAVVQKVLGITFSGTGRDQKIEVVQKSFLGTILKLLVPLMTTSEENKYTVTDLENAKSFYWNLIQALGNMLTSLLRGKNYDYLIKPLVSNQNIWKVVKTTNIYFPNSSGKLMYQQISVQFDPTGIKLEDNSIVDNNHKATYELTFRRTSQLDQFAFTQIVRRNNRR